MTDDFYAELAADYDRVIRWASRLEAERPLFGALWQRHETRTVLDAACGSGRHFALFAEAGLAAAGCDASAAMLEQARRNTAALDPPPRLLQCAWANLPRCFGEERFDAVLCLGNSLPYVTDAETLSRSLAGLWSRVADGGFLLLQLKNFAKLLRERPRFLPLSWEERGEAATVCLREYEYGPETVDFHVVLLDRRAAQWSLRHHCTPLAPWRADDLVPALEGLGASCAVCGSLALEPFEPETSPDLVVLARHA